MIHSVEKRKKRVNGVLTVARLYSLRYRIGDMPCDKWVSLGVTDKGVARVKADLFIKDLEREHAGLAMPKKQVEAGNLPVTALFAEFIAEMTARRRDAKYIEVTNARVSKVIKEAKWRNLRDVTADSFLSWRRANGHLGAKTRNDYLASVKGFLEWLVGLDRLQSNPLRKVGKVQEKGDEKRQRRAFTLDELKRLCAGSDWRGLIYLTAAFTGLRRNEIAELQWGDVRQTGQGMVLSLRAAVTKNRLASSIPVHPGLAAELATIRPHPSAVRPADKVFPRMPRMERFRLDLEAARIPYEDEHGRFADFHALRYTFATFLTIFEAGQRVTQELMRHHDPKLTAMLYTDAAHLPLRDAVENIPWLKCTQIGAQISGATGYSESHAVASTRLPETTKPADNQRVRRGVSRPDTLGPMVAGVGFEPTTFRL